VQPLFDLADPTHPIWDTVNQSSSNDGHHSSAVGGSSSASGTANSINNNNSSSLSSKANEDSFYPPIQIKQGLLDYDYDDEDDGDNGNNSGPGPSNVHSNNSNSNQGAKNDGSNALAGLDALGSILSNPEILKQLQTLQEQMAAATQFNPNQPNSNAYLIQDQERQRKLAELNKQEAAFDQRLAQTVAVSRI